jgi:succinate dehydrogenase flavin-adding protein (antitoxin of CptAB toxin-antitoxin module)
MYQSNQIKFKLIYPSSNEISKLNHYVSVINSLRNQVSRFKQLIEKLDQDVYTQKVVMKFYQKQLKVFQKEQKHIYELLQKSLIDM